MLPPPYPHDDPFTNNCKKIMCILKKIRGKGNAKQPIGKNAAFRECFFKIGDVRSLIANFLFQSLTRDISESMENLAIDSLLRWKLIERSFLTTSLNQFFLE